MILYKYKPTSPGVRHRQDIIFLKNFHNPMKWQFIKKLRLGGRSSYNKILLIKRKSPNLKLHINILEKKYLSDKQSLIINVNYFYKNRSFTGLAKFTNGAYANVALSHGIIPGDFIKTTIIPVFFFENYNLGDTTILKWAEPLNIINSIYIFDKQKTMFTKAAGSKSMVLNIDHEKNYSKVRLSSGLDRFFFNYNYVTIGQCSNIEAKDRILGKAGVNILNGRKSSVRGVAMNPVDHPNGGRTKTASPLRTPWGRIAKNNK